MDTKNGRNNFHPNGKKPIIDEMTDLAAQAAGTLAETAVKAAAKKAKTAVAKRLPRPVKKAAKTIAKATKVPKKRVKKTKSSKRSPKTISQGLDVDRRQENGHDSCQEKGKAAVRDGMLFTARGSKSRPFALIAIFRRTYQAANCPICVISPPGFFTVSAKEALALPASRCIRPNVVTFSRVGPQS